MISQTLALFIDSYRELAAKKIFWIATAISGLVVLALAAVGFSADGNLAILWYETEFPAEQFFGDRDIFYKSVFVNLGLGVWLAWGATILALASTAGVFPEFLAGGAIDLALSKPIGRTRLFLTKFAASLLFVALQVAVFTAASFIVIGVRGGAWEPALFLAVPIVTLFYSFLYCLTALFGIITRSAITSLILTLLVWFVVFVVHSAEAGLLGWRTQTETRVHIYETTIARLERAVEGETPTTQDAADEPITEPTDETEDRVKNLFEPFLRFNDEQVSAARLERAKSSLESARESRDTAAHYHNIALGVKTFLPKTAETISLLERWLIAEADLPDFQQDEPIQIEMPVDEEGEMTRPMRRAESRIVQAEMQRKYRDRSVAWVLGTSLLFEAAVLALAAWRFNRKDF